MNCNASGPTVTRHPFASKRSMMVFHERGNEIREIFELPTRYDAIAPIAKGAYGFVCAARDNELVDIFIADTPQEYDDPALSKQEKEEMYDAFTTVAVKKLKNLFDQNQPRLWLCATREIQLMTAFKHDNVTSAIDFFIPLGECETITYDSVQRLRHSFDSVYVVMKKMDYTLREVLDSSFLASGNDEDEGTEADKEANTPVVCPNTGLELHPLERDYRKFILYQLLRGVGYLHNCHVMHRDIKPENILLDRNYNTQVCDFGQGRDGVAPGSGVLETILDNCTQWYAAPETLTLAIVASSMGSLNYENLHAADVWSIGCIAAEMLIGRPIFYSSRFGGVGQLRSIVSILGDIPDADVEGILKLRDVETREIFALELQKKRDSNITYATSRLRSLLKSPFGDEDDEEIKLIEKFLVYNPRQRLRIVDALHSPYFVNEGYEPVIDSNETTTLVQAVHKETITDAENGREFLWSLFLKRHPEVEKLIQVLRSEKGRSASMCGHAPLSSEPSMDTPSCGDSTKPDD